LEQFQMKKPPPVKSKTKKKASKAFGRAKPSSKPVVIEQGSWTKLVNRIKSAAKAARKRVTRVR
jgi:hypothetical protein